MTPQGWTSGETLAEFYKMPPAASKLYKWIARKGGRVTARQVQRSCRWLRGPSEAEAALEELARQGIGKWKTVLPKNGPGRPTRVFVLRFPLITFFLGDPSCQNWVRLPTKY